MNNSNESDSDSKKPSEKKDLEVVTPEIILENEQDSLDVSPTKERFTHSIQSSHTSKAALEEVHEIKKRLVKHEVDNLKKEARTASSYRFIALLAIGFILGIAIVVYILITTGNF